MTDSNPHSAKRCSRLRRPHPGSRRSRWRLWFCLSLALLAGPVTARDDTAASLASRHKAVQSALAASTLGVPVLVSSVEEGDRTQGEVDALLAQPFDTLVAQLRQPREWCEMVLLHLNVKGCTHEPAAGTDWVTFYSGRKFYEKATDAYPLRFAFSVPAASPEHLQVVLSAESGPLGTRDYRITLSAIPIAQGSFVRFGYTYRSSGFSRLAAGTYLSTIGADKVGFTVTGTGSDGQPQYVSGQRGIVERNAVRYYLAIQAYLEALPLAPEKRFEQTMQRWFELTERWTRQLHELDQSEYLANKRRERAEQLQMQQAIDSKSARRP